MSAAGGPPTPLDALGAWIRDPASNPPPAGIEPRRLAVYGELFYRNVEGLLASAFPVLRRTLDEDAWHALARGFLRDHPARTPMFTELARELLRYLDARESAGLGDPPWLRELAHYEWVELALQVSEARPDDAAVDRHGDLLAGCPVLSPLAWPLAYAWPVHRIGPGHVPAGPPAAPTLLLVRRADDGTVAFSALTPLAFRLLQRIEEDSSRTGRAHLADLAAEAGATDVDSFIAQGAALLESFRADGTVPGTRMASEPWRGAAGADTAL